MAIKMSDVRAWLDAEEPDYAGAKRKLGEAALPLLMQLVKGGDLALATKATYLASMIRSPKTVPVLEAAAASSEPVLRVAAAAGIRNLPVTQAERLMDRLQTDPDSGVRKVMLRSAAAFTSPRVAERLQRMAKTDPEPFLRELATTAARGMKPARK